MKISSSLRRKAKKLKHPEYYQDVFTEGVSIEPFDKLQRHRPLGKISLS
jgi:hypothetical protein